MTRHEAAHSRAIEYHKQVLAIFQDIGDRRGEGNALYYVSLELDKLGERARAIPLAEAALMIYEQIESPTANLCATCLPTGATSHPIKAGQTPTDPQQNNSGAASSVTAPRHTRNS